MKECATTEEALEQVKQGQQVRLGGLVIGHGPSLIPHDELIDADMRQWIEDEPGDPK